MQRRLLVSYGRPLFLYIGGAVTAIFAVLGAVLSARDVARTALPWWAWLLICLGALAVVFYAHARMIIRAEARIRELELKESGDIRLSWQEDIQSRHHSAAHGKRAVFQAQRPLDSVAFYVICSASVVCELTEIRVTGPTVLQEIRTSGLSPVVPIQLPSFRFLPEKPLVIEIFGPKSFSVVGLAGENLGRGDWALNWLRDQMRPA